MTFLIFRDKWNGARIILQKYPWKPIYRQLGTIMQPRVTWCVASVVYLTTLNFNVILSAKRVWPIMTSETLYVKSLPTPWLDMKKKRI